MRGDLRRALLQRFEACLPPLALRTDVRGYTREPVDNILPALAADDDLLADFERAAGGELTGDPPRFCAAHSSSALAVNSFGPYRLHPERLELAGLGGFDDAAFAKRLASGPASRAPRLDFFATGPAGVVAVAATFTETFRERAARLPASYGASVARWAEPAWADLYESLLVEPGRFRRVDAARMLEHHLGMRHALAGDGRPAVLLYLYWEPSNAEHVPEARGHRAEVASLQGEVAGSRIRFEALSYETLWSHMIAGAATDELRLHVEALRARYAFPVISSGN